MAKQRQGHQRPAGPRVRKRPHHQVLIESGIREVSVLAPVPRDGLAQRFTARFLVPLHDSVHHVGEYDVVVPFSGNPSACSNFAWGLKDQSARISRRHATTFARVDTARRTDTLPHSRWPSQISHERDGERLPAQRSLRSSTGSISTSTWRLFPPPPRMSPRKGLTSP